MRSVPLTADVVLGSTGNCFCPCWYDLEVEEEELGREEGRDWSGLLGLLAALLSVPFILFVILLSALLILLLLLLVILEDFSITESTSIR